jgi:peptidoglycan/xylan/chitin deacetylase (PgdA/CDA1 family)
MKYKILFIIFAFLFLTPAIIWQMFYYIPQKNIAIKSEGQQKQSIELGDRVFAPILVFHHIKTPSRFLGKLAKNFFIDSDQFEKILQDLLKNNYQVVFVSEMADYIRKGDKLPTNIIAITFDDGSEDFYTNAYPILAKYNIKSSVYPIVGAHTENFLSAEQIIELDKSGLVEFGSHTWSHQYLTRLKKEDQHRELKSGKDYLEKLLNKKIETLCYPFGLYDKELEQMAMGLGFTIGLKYNYSFWQAPANLMEMSRLGVMPGVDVIKLLDKMKKE